MSQKEYFEIQEEDNNNNYLLLSKINYELYDMFNNRIYLINNFLLKDEKIKSEFIIDLKEMNFFNFFLIYIIKTRNNRVIGNFLKLNKPIFRVNNNQIKKADDLYNKLRLLLPKFLIICIFNSYELSKIIKVSNKKFTKTIFGIIQIYYLNDLIDNENLTNIIKMKLISSLYKDDNKIFNKEFLNIKNKTIINILAFEEIINFLLSFKSKPMSNKKISDFTKVINNIVAYIEQQFLTHNNTFLLSNVLSFYRLLELSQISFECIDNIIPLLKKVYKYSFKCEYCFNDLSEQFLLKENEKINKKNNNLIAKNYFLYELFFYENSLINKEKYLIQNGFIFNDNPNNGIILYNNNSFSFANESFSIVISFCLINNNIIKRKNNYSGKNLDNKKYTIFSFTNNDNDNTICFNFFIHNNIIKMTLLGEIYELFTNIEYNKTYVLWQFLLGNKTIFYLNEKKIIKEDLLYPKGIYDINLGFNNNKTQNNFVGMIGTFILFNKSIIKDYDDENIKYYEKILFELKCNYEDIIYINYRTEFSFLEPNIQKILDDLSQDNISSFIEVIISSKSIMSDDFCCCSNNVKKAYKANYFMDNNRSQSMISFKDENIDINLDSYNFNCKNCLVTYPFHFNYSFPIFINNNGIKFLEMELYYFIGIIDFYSIKGSKNKTKEETPRIKGQNISNQEIKNINEGQNNLYHKIKYIVNLFLFCLKTMNKTQEKRNQKDIDNFFCTLNNLISLYSKNNIKIDLIFLNHILSHINLLINKKKFFEYCGFLFEFESYDVKDDTVFNLLFQTLFVYLEDNVDNFLNPILFSKLLSFEKLYLYDNLKESKKKYSKFIRKCISLSLENNNLDCFSIFICKLKKYKGIRNIKITEEEIIEEPETIKNKTNQNNKRPSDRHITNEDSDLSHKKREEKEIKEMNNLLLMYKYLKNLYLSLKKNDTYQVFINFCSEDDENLINFLNEEFNYLSYEYDIRKINTEINENNGILLDIMTNDTDSLNEIIYDKRIENKEKIEHSETHNMKLKYSELIKSLCIRFLDDIIFDENIKSLKDELSKEEISTTVDKKKRKSFKSSSSDIYKSFAYFNLTLPTQNFIGGGDTFYSNSNNSSTKYLDINPIENILMKKFDFYYDFTISPYTFNSFFLLLFRNLSNEEKLKYIKNIKTEYHYQSLFQKKNYNYFVSTLIILKLIKRVGEENLDTCFMDKLEFFEYVYQRFNNLILDMLNYYIEKKDDFKNIVKKLFCKEDYGTIFYLSILDSLKKHKDITYLVFNNKHLTYKKEINNNNLIDKFIEKVKKSLYEIIDKTIYELTGPFYFNLLFEMYIKDYDDYNNCDFAINIIEYIINKFIEYENKNSSSSKETINEKVEINNYNLVALIYKITFFIPKRKYLIENATFIQTIVLYLSEFCNKSKLLYLKILFPIGEKNESYSQKLILEILFEIFIELYMEFQKNLNQQKCQMFEAIINGLLIKSSSGIDNNKNNLGRTISVYSGSSNEKIKNKKESLFQDYTICFIMDEFSINEPDSILTNFKKNILKKYLINYNLNEHTFSVIILFLIKLCIYINKLEEIDKSSNLLDFLIKVCDLLCKDAKKLQQKYMAYNPLISKNENFRDLYNEFLYYILKEYNLNKVYNKEELISKVNKYSKDSKNYTYFSYNNSKEDEKTRLFSVQSQLKYFSTNRRKSHYSSYSNLLDAVNPGNRGFEKEDFSISKRLTSKFISHKYSPNSNSLNELHSTNNKKYKIGSSNCIRNEKYRNDIYKIVPKFRKFFIRNHFSLYFLKLLTYDEDFITIKKIYNYLYHNEIEDINDYSLNYPTKIKNRLGNNYVKHFLKKDFSFTSSKYFKYSHKCISNRKFIPKIKYLFPKKELLEELIYSNINIKIKEDKNLVKRNCELITYNGAVFGNIYIFENCIVFISDLENDKRKEQDILDYVCCSMDFDFLDEKKNKIIDFNETKEVISHKFLYSWISLEIFMKDGKSYLLNFFNEETCNYIIEIFKSNNIFVINDIKDYFDKKDYVKKWKDGQKSTYEYLLILNKLSSRTYNDSNQYPVMPWIFLKNNNIRNFDIPMSIQNEEAKNKFLKIAYDSSSKQNRWHSNHYSTSAYICYYLMRANPFTDSMIKFQSNNFDVPDRQFFDLGQTLTLCEYNNNNREPIPELYTIPEVYINLNNNDFGKLSINENNRIHNVQFAPYAYNAYEFIYKFRYMLNNDEEVNSKINLWFDFIFGINQYNKDNISGKGLRNFNKYSYSQNVNIRNNINTLKNKQKSESFIYNNIKYIIGMVISFGQCPSQLLTYEHPKRIYTNGIHNILLSSAVKTKLNENEKDLRNNTNENISLDNSQSSDDGKMVQKLYDNNSTNYSIIYFRKSLSKNNLYCILNNKEIEIYQKDSRYVEYKYKRKIIFSKNYLLFKKTEYGYPILKPKYLFCELKEEHFIFCRYLDNSIKLVMPNLESNFLLDSFVTTIIRIDEREFITGDSKGKLIHWRINFDNPLKIKLKLIKKINSNNSSITAIAYSNRLNIVISADKATAIIRSFNDFEFLTYINIHDEEIASDDNNNELIVDIKISNYDFIYLLINKGNNNYKLKGYSLNGICFGQYEEKITNFELTKGGKVLVGLAHMGMVLVLDPIDFHVLFSRFIISNECLFYHFYFEKPNIIFFGLKDEEGSKIRLIKLEQNEIKFFI